MPFEHADELLFGRWCRYSESHSCQDGMPLDGRTGKRLFFWFAERHNHTWLKQIDRNAISLGSGKRMLVKGGKLDPKYLITVPEDLGAPV
jgi:hypothetical protein